MSDLKYADAREALKSIILKNSIKFGDFILASGRKSSYYIDARLTTLDPAGAHLIGSLIFSRIKALGLEPDAIGGLTMGADPIALAVAMKSEEAGEPIQAIVVRKEVKGHGRKRRIEGNFKPGDDIVVVEDVGSTGSSAVEAVKAIREEGGVVIHVFIVVDRMMGAMEALENAGVSAEAIFRIDELLGRKPE